MTSPRGTGARPTVSESLAALLARLLGRSPKMVPVPARIRGNDRHPTQTRADRW